jgi:hypothetical protein
MQDHIAIYFVRGLAYERRTISAHLNGSICKGSLLALALDLWASSTTEGELETYKDSQDHGLSERKLTE